MQKKRGDSQSWSQLSMKEDKLAIEYWKKWIDKNKKQED